MQNYGYQPPPTPRQQETPIFASGGVQVTTARFICYQQTFPMGAITSVSSFTTPAAKNGPTLMAFWCGFWAVLWTIGIFIQPSGTTIVPAAFSVCLTAACIAWVRSRHASYGVMITTSGMNVRALTSPDVTLVQAIVGALNQALSLRA